MRRAPRAPGRVALAAGEMAGEQVRVEAVEGHRGQLSVEVSIADGDQDRRQEAALLMNHAPALLAILQRAARVIEKG